MEIFSLCELDKNKLIYETNKYSINQILEKINNSVVLVLDNNHTHITNFVSAKKYYRYFKNEELNMDKTSYIVWYSAKNNIIQQEAGIIAVELLINLPQTIKYIKFNDDFNNSIDG
jgi:L-rhamnose isomerase